MNIQSTESDTPLFVSCCMNSVHGTTDKRDIMSAVDTRFFILD
jgi:hypothetical protein